MSNPRRFLFGCLLVAGSLPAQVPERPDRGPFSTTGAGFVTAGAGNDLLLYRADRAQTVPFSQPTPSFPLFTLDAIFHQLTPSQRQLVELDAISTGNDLIPIGVVQGTFRITQQGAALGWSALFFSFRRSSVTPATPAPMGPRALDGAGADLYSWITPGSNVLGGFESEVFLDVGAETLGLSRQAEIRGIDVPMALMVQSELASVPLFAGHPNDFFFSLTRSSAQALTGILPGVQPVDHSGATVFRVIWNGSSWGSIDVAARASELGLDHGDSDPSNDEDLDALAVDAAVVEPRFVYSVVAAPGWPQLLHYRAGLLPDSGRGQLFDADGRPITDHIGGSDIDAVCGLDPEAMLLSPWFGVPHSAVPNPPLILSATPMLSAPVSSHTLMVDVHGPRLDGGDDLQALPGIVAIEGSLNGFGGTPSWTVLALDFTWNGFGTFRTQLPLQPVFGAAVQLRARFLSTASVVTESSDVFTIL